MSKHRMDMHPLAEMNDVLKAYAFFGYASAEDRRYIAEHDAVEITENSTVEVCASTVAMLISPHVDQVNVLLKDKAKLRHYDNSIELIQKESERRDNKKITYTGNVAAAHQRLDELEKEIVNEDTPAERMKTLVWEVVFMLGFLALAVYSVMTGSVADFVIGVVSADWFIVAFSVAFLILGFLFGFFAVGLLMLLPVVLILGFPELTAILVNGMLFLLAALFLSVAFSEIKGIITYRPLSEEEHLKNQERIAEKEDLSRELKEYSDIMVTKLEIMRNKFVDNEKTFFQEMHNKIGGTYDVSAVYDVFSFLKRYYRGIKR